MRNKHRLHRRGLAAYATIALLIVALLPLAAFASQSQEPPVRGDCGNCEQLFQEQERTREFVPEVKEQKHKEYKFRTRTLIPGEAETHKWARFTIQKSVWATGAPYNGGQGFGAAYYVGTNSSVFVSNDPLIVDLKALGHAEGPLGDGVRRVGIGVADANATRFDASWRYSATGTYYYRLIDTEIVDQVNEPEGVGWIDLGGNGDGADAKWSNWSKFSEWSLTDDAPAPSDTLQVDKRAKWVIDVPYQAAHYTDWSDWKDVGEPFTGYEGPLDTPTPEEGKGVKKQTRVIELEGEFDCPPCPSTTTSTSTTVAESTTTMPTTTTVPEETTTTVVVTTTNPTTEETLPFTGIEGYYGGLAVVLLALGGLMLVASRKLEGDSN